MVFNNVPAKGVIGVFDNFRRAVFRVGRCFHTPTVIVDFIRGEIAFQIIVPELDLPIVFPGRRLGKDNTIIIAIIFDMGNHNAIQVNVAFTCSVIILNGSSDQIAFCVVVFVLVAPVELTI